MGRPQKQQEAKTLGLENGSVLMSLMVEEEFGMSLEEYKQMALSERETLGAMHPLNWLVANPAEISEDPPTPDDPS